MKVFLANKAQLIRNNVVKNIRGESIMVVNVFLQSIQNVL